MNGCPDAHLLHVCVAHKGYVHILHTRPALLRQLLSSFNSVETTRGALKLR